MARTALRLRLRAARRSGRRRVHRRGRPQRRHPPQAARIRDELVRVVVLEKGSEIGAHVMSGAAIKPWTRSSLTGTRSIRTFPGAAHHLIGDAAAHQKILDPDPAPAADEQQGQQHRSLPRQRVARRHRTRGGVGVYSGCAGAKFLLSPSPDAEDAQGRKVRSVRGVVTHDVSSRASARRGRASSPASRSAHSLPF
ncbi:hypothetical protein K438DRAFT_193381 [Mycena galopus ATCC 62051]|nr:hypothetical protein K438DRAFT_223022 [Mycena galopus ATCC 62051]KAF8171372.1 hypothetical protein K438DRAFT_193381 [Mycena galopus ATCC 62051]